MVLTRVFPDLDVTIKNSVVSSVITACKNNIKCDRHIKIEGSLGVIIDDGEIIFIHLSETISQYSLSTQGPADSSNINSGIDHASSEKLTTGVIRNENISEIQTGRAVNPEISSSQSIGIGENGMNDSPVERSHNTNENQEGSDYEEILRKIKEEKENEMSDAVGLCFVTPLNKESLNDVFDDNYDEYQDIKTNMICPDAYLINSDLVVQPNELPIDASTRSISSQEDFPLEMDFDGEPKPTSQKSAENEIIKVLMDHPLGRNILREYNDTGTIGKSRHVLVQILVSNLTKTNFYPSTREKICLAKSIIETFPCLKGTGPLGFEDFYTPYSSKMCDSGRKKIIPAHGSIEERLKNVRKALKLGQQNPDL